MLDEIEVTNGLRQGCTMAPTLFNMYACVVLERWLEKAEGVEGIGTHILYKLDQQLFKEYQGRQGMHVNQAEKKAIGMAGASL